VLDEVASLVEQLASTVLAADVDDLAALATAHSCVLRIAAESGAVTPAGLGARLVRTSRDAEQLIEQIILRTPADLNDSLRTLGATVESLQGLLRGDVPVDDAPAVAAARPTAGIQQQSQAAGAPHGAGDDDQTIEPESPVHADDVSLASEFISEARTHIELAEANLLRLEEAPGDPEAVNAIFRGFHTVKGGAGFLNLKQIGALAHSAENLLDLARKGKLALAGDVVDVVLESIDLLKSLVGLLEVAVRDGAPTPVEPRLPGLLRRLHRAADLSPPAAAAPAPDAPAGDAAAEVGQAPTAEAKASDAGAHGTGGGDAAVKVSTERLDSLINMVGELVIAQSMVRQDVTALAASNHRVIRNMSQLGKMTRELQDLSMSMRMVPIQGVFQKMARVVRDVSRKAGKEVEFVVIGGDTELDRNVVEAIGDPLVHMVRNSVDHGLEPAAERLAAGKSRAGRVELRARHQAGHIVIQIIDDGRGLNVQKIRKKAVEAGIVGPDDVLTDQQTFQLIFAAGLSTADKITDISGRGVGMDVVRKNVEALRGRIDIESAAGRGSTFSIHLPLTLAVIDGMVVRVGDQRYIIPITSIEQTIRPKPEQLSTVQQRGELCMVRGRLLPLTRLHRLFGVTPRTTDPADALVVIVQDNQRAACVLVDELLGQQQVVIKSLGDGIGAVPGVTGGAILGDGGISLILDIPGLIDLTTAGDR